ncbi:MAG: flavin reductase family protein [Candidatus Hermodarchaeota archaeon]
MSKNKIRLGPYLYPMPVVLIGVNVNGKPNFMPLAWISIVEHKPPMISISSNQGHYTNLGIKENKTFSVNSISEDLIIPMDYCGLNSGKDLDKSNIFEIFYGELKTAPMIQSSPLTLECKVIKLIDTEMGHDIFIGEIVAAYSEEKYLTNGIPDIKKMNTIFFSMNDNQYWKIGENVGRAWNIGKSYKKE